MVRPLLHKSIFPVIAIFSAILSIATAGTADAKPRHQRPERTSSAPIVCDVRGCSDRVAALRALVPAAASVRRKAGQMQHSRLRGGDATITCDMRGCSDRAIRARGEELTAMAAVVPMRARQRRGLTGAVNAEVVCDMRGCSDRAAPGSAATQRIIDANGNSADAVIIGQRPPGCPRQFCGCEASLYLFGESRPELNLAYNWVRKFARTSPAPGMVAARSGHVMVLISHAGGNDWLVHDGNSGGGLTRRHVMSINRYFIVDPRSSRSATR